MSKVEGSAREWRGRRGCEGGWGEEVAGWAVGMALRSPVFYGSEPPYTRPPSATRLWMRRSPIV